MADLDVIIVNWNTRQLLRECLDSVFKQDGSVQFQVFVVDNASTDGSQEMVVGEFPKAHLIRNQENVGFAAANNQVFPLCSSEYVMLLNSDTVVRPNVFRDLLEFMRTHPE